MPTYRYDPLLELDCYASVSLVLRNLKARGSSNFFVPKRNTLAVCTHRSSSNQARKFRFGMVA
jgi:hypothetical protein